LEKNITRERIQQKKRQIAERPTKAKKGGLIAAHWLGKDWDPTAGLGGESHQSTERNLSQGDKEEKLNG